MTTAKHEEPEHLTVGKTTGAAQKSEARPGDIQSINEPPGSNVLPPNEAPDPVKAKAPAKDDDDDKHSGSKHKR